MIDILTVTASRKSGSKRTCQNTKADMTPMVDLGFLLITFFLFNAVISKPRVLELLMPAEGDSTGAAESRTLTILPQGNEVVFWYEGNPDRGNRLNKAYMTSAQNSLREAIQLKQKKLRIQYGTDEGLMVIIKPGEECSYQELIAALDEMTINAVRKYAISSKDSTDKRLLSVWRP
jgi:biopolymer transport protein ExbD